MKESFQRPLSLLSRQDCRSSKSVSRAGKYCFPLYKIFLRHGFIQKNVDEDKENFMNGRNRADGTNALEERLNQYIVSERNKAVSDLSLIHISSSLCSSVMPA